MNATRLTILLLTVLLGTNVYRGASQSITIDEAFTYNAFLAGPLGDLLNQYDANHHVLHSFLCKISIGILGLSEFSFRLPSLLGGLLYFMAAFRLGRLLFGSGWALPLSISLLTLSPGLLDYFSAARGYGMAAAFLMLAILQMAHYDDRPGRLERGALCLAASVASNLSFAFPAVALALVFALSMARENRLADAVDRFLVPGLVTAFTILVLPLTHLRPHHFYAGLPTLRESVESVWGSFLSSDLSRTPAPQGIWFLLPVVTLAAALSRGGPLRKITPAARVLRLSTAALVGSVLLLVTGHYLLGILYPVRRTGLYWIPLLVLTCLALAAHIVNTSRGRRAAVPFAAAGLALAAQFLSQWSVSRYAEWPYDSDTKRVVKRIIEDHKSHPSPEVTVGATWGVEPGVNFYRYRYRLHWMLPVVRELEGVKALDYYVLRGDDRSLVEKRGLETLYANEATLTTLAVPKR
ncbi:MAG TPA: hypothetical protein VL285_03785 [Bryobacteraceae bacterium]|nr:hypothetical protein [Bryobacteraceae bacterium]